MAAMAPTDEAHVNTESAVLARVLDRSSDGVVLHDGAGHVVAANKRAEALLGGRPDSFESYRFFSPAGDAVLPAAAPPAKVYAGAATETADVIVRTAADAVPRRVRVSAERIEAGDETLRAVLVTLVDLSEVEAVEGLQKEVFGIVGHDLRNPLSAIRMTAQLLGRPTPMPDERRKELSDRILSASKRMDNLVGSLLDYARAKGGATVALARETMDLEALCRKLIAEQSANPAAAGRTFDVDVKGSSSGQWDGGRLTQVVANLLSNAVLHGETNTPVKLTLDGSAADVLRMSVHNFGSAIPPDMHEVIFEPFRTVRSTTRRGMGLGLFVVKQMVEAHGGKIAVRSTDAEGTTFTVDLPRVLPR